MCRKLTQYLNTRHLTVQNNPMLSSGLVDKCFRHIMWLCKPKVGIIRFCLCMCVCVCV